MMDKEKAVAFVERCATSHIKHECNNDQGRREKYVMDLVVAFIRNPGSTAKPKIETGQNSKTVKSNG